VHDKDGFEPVTLTADWMDHKPGDVVRVDPERARQMRKDGLATGAKEPQPHPDFPGLTVEPLPEPSSPRELQVQPFMGNPVPTQTQIDDAGDFPAVVQRHMEEKVKEPWIKETPSAPPVPPSRRRRATDDLPTPPLTPDLKIRNQE
jgi:hypothetical protein